SWPMLVFLRKVIVDLLVSGGPEPAVTSGQPEDLRWPFAHRYSAAAAPAPQPETAKLQKITHTPTSHRSRSPSPYTARRAALADGSRPLDPAERRSRTVARPLVPPPPTPLLRPGLQLHFQRIRLEPCAL